ncbi:MAG: hypothetical protein M1825_006055 [Sarcosagium campestre]|nr:MAG: hypothetical protein M1825_006055 [Sarcosagium campestre]
MSTHTMSEFSFPLPGGGHASQPAPLLRTDDSLPLRRRKGKLTAHKKLRRPLSLDGRSSQPTLQSGESENRRQRFMSISISLSEPDDDDVADFDFDIPSPISNREDLLMPEPQHPLQHRSSSPLLGRSPLTQPAKPLSPPPPSTVRPSEKSDSSSTLQDYYDASESPLAISQQTSASSARDMALRKGRPAIYEWDEEEEDVVVPRRADSKASAKKRAERKRAEKNRTDRNRADKVLSCIAEERSPALRLDLSKLFPKPRTTSGGLLSPQRLVHSPSNLSLASEVSSAALRDDPTDAPKLNESDAFVQSFRLPPVIPPAAPSDDSRESTPVLVSPQDDSGNDLAVAVVAGPFSPPKESPGHKGIFSAPSYYGAQLKNQISSVLRGRGILGRSTSRPEIKDTTIPSMSSSSTPRPSPRPIETRALAPVWDDCSLDSASSGVTADSTRSSTASIFSNTNLQEQSVLTVSSDDEDSAQEDDFDLYIRNVKVSNGEVRAAIRRAETISLGRAQRKRHPQKSFLISDTRSLGRGSHSDVRPLPTSKYLAASGVLGLSHHRNRSASYLGSSPRLTPSKDRRPQSSDGPTMNPRSSWLNVQRTRPTRGTEASQATKQQDNVMVVTREEEDLLEALGHELEDSGVYEMSSDFEAAMMGVPMMSPTYEAADDESSVDHFIRQPSLDTKVGPERHRTQNSLVSPLRYSPEEPVPRRYVPRRPPVGPLLSRNEGQHHRTRTASSGCLTKAEQHEGFYEQDLKRSTEADARTSGLPQEWFDNLAAKRNSDASRLSGPFSEDIYY